MDGRSGEGRRGAEPSAAEETGRDPQGLVAEDPLLAVEDEHASIGFYLARQRELRGISLEEFAEMTRIPIRSLERLEAGHFDRGADGFSRGFVRTVATALGLDPADTVLRMQSDVPVGDEATGHRRVILRRAGLATAVVLFLAAFVGIVRAVSDGQETEAEPSEPVHIFRQDPVRALAEGDPPLAKP